MAEELLSSLGCADIPSLTVYNKCDLVHPSMRPRDTADTVCLSAKTGEGIAALLTRTETSFSGRMVPLDLLLPYSAGAVLPLIRQNGQIHAISYTDAGTRLTVSVPKSMEAQLASYALQEAAEISDTQYKAD